VKLFRQDAGLLIGSVSHLAEQRSLAGIRLGSGTGG